VFGVARAGLRLVGGGQQSEQAVVELGAEDRQTLAVGGQRVGVGVFDPADEAVNPHQRRCVVQAAARGEKVRLCVRCVTIRQISCLLVVLRLARVCRMAG
jgi:hypothetical protein